MRLKKSAKTSFGRDVTDLRAKFANAAAFFWQHPVLWLPVLAADVLKSFFEQADGVLRHAVIVWTTPQSVFGGYGGGTSLPLTPLILGGLLERLANVFGIFCYLYAFAILARIVPIVQRSQRPEHFLPKALPEKMWPTLGLSTLAWIALPLGSALALLLPHYSFRAVLVVTLLVLMPVLYFLTPVLLRYARANSGTSLPHEEDHLVDAGFLFFAEVVSSGLGYNLAQIASQDPHLSRFTTHGISSFLFATCVSLLTSLPYAFAMIGLTLCELPPGLFVYGTLQPDRAPADIQKHARRLVWRSEGSTPGYLQDLGEYPGLLPSSTGQTVEGSLFYLPDDEGTLLATLDAYEGYDARSPETSLFVRELRPILFADGHTERHWVYVYNREPPTAE